MILQHHGKLIYLVAGYDGTGYNDIIYYDTINEIIGYIQYGSNMEWVYSVKYRIYYLMDIFMIQVVMYNIMTYIIVI